MRPVPFESSERELQTAPVSSKLRCSEMVVMFIFDNFYFQFHFHHLEMEMVFGNGSGKFEFQMSNMWTYIPLKNFKAIQKSIYSSRSDDFYLLV